VGWLLALANLVNMLTDQSPYYERPKTTVILLHIID